MKRPLDEVYPEHLRRVGKIMFEALDAAVEASDGDAKAIFAALVTNVAQFAYMTGTTTAEILQLMQKSEAHFTAAGMDPAEYGAQILREAGYKEEQYKKFGLEDNEE